MEQICTLSGEKFEISEQEIELRKKFGVFDLPKVAPKYRFRHLGAFWPHFNIHKRNSDYSGKPIISVLGENCSYPVWHRDEWLQNANPPSADFNFNRGFFEQIWELARQCAIPHNQGILNENCEYTDDWWRSKNCYLCHSGLSDEDLAYCFRLLSCKDCQFCAFSFYLELCTDVIHSRNCYAVNYALNCRNCDNSAFLYDCRHCSDCLFCWNLRNKKYCIANKQLTREEYEAEKAKFNLASRKNYEMAKERFHNLIMGKAWWRALQMDKCENSSGDFQENNKNAKNCYFASECEDCTNHVRTARAKDCLDTVNVAIESEMCHMSASVCDNVYHILYSHNIANSRFIEYSGFLERSEHCFGCFGLVGKKYHILNKPYSKEEYEVLIEKIKEKMRLEGMYGEFFPGYFAACPYEESYSGFYWPLSREEQISLLFNANNNPQRKKEANFLAFSEVPDDALKATKEVCENVFWDEEAGRPFQIREVDLRFCQKNKVPLMNSFYIKRLKENFRWLFFSGELHYIKCGKCGVDTETGLPAVLNGRILCEQCYLQEVG